MCEKSLGAGDYVRDAAKFRCCETCSDDYQICIKDEKNGAKQIQREYKCTEDAYSCLCNLNCKCTQQN